MNERFRKLVADSICFSTDWLEGEWIEYQADGNWWHRRIGAQAQLLWYRAHNNRLYCWADEARDGS